MEVPHKIIRDFIIQLPVKLSTQHKSQILFSSIDVSLVFSDGDIETFMFDKIDCLIHSYFSDRHPATFSPDDFFSYANKTATMLIISTYSQTMTGGRSDNDSRPEGGSILSSVKDVKERKVVNFSSIVDDLERWNIVRVEESKNVLTHDYDPRRFYFSGETDFVEVGCLGTDMCGDITKKVIDEWMKLKAKKTIANE